VAVEPAEFDERYERLLRTLSQLADLLGIHDERRWATWISTDRVRIENGQRYGLEHLLGAYGGMGSFNDVLLADTSANAQLRHLSSDAYADASALLRDLDRG
jgi:hypothetical protein